MARETFEYMIEVFDLSSKDVIEKTLNSLGRAGWELISIEDSTLFIFKRKKVEPAKELLTG
jgi:hypothetical protein